MNAFLTARSRCQSRKAFTMVELLAVIAIIGILAALVIVSTRRMIIQSHRATSVSNLRQIGVAVHLYVNDNKGYFPDIRPPDGGVETYWWSLVSPYLTGGTAASTWDDLAKVKVLRSDYQSEKIATALNRSFFADKPSYGMNFNLGRSAAGGAAGATNRVMLRQVPFPAETLACTEAAFNTSTVQAPLTPGTLGTSAQDADGVYTGGAIAGVSHLLWVDGHVSSTDDVLKYTRSPYGSGHAKDVWRRGF